MAAAMADKSLLGTTAAETSHYMENINRAHLFNSVHSLNTEQTEQYIIWLYLVPPYTLLYIDG